MKTWLYLTAEGAGAPCANWRCCVWSPSGERRCLPLHEAARELNGRVVDVLLPMEMCSWMRSDPWPSRRQPRPQALAFAIEEQLSENLEALHIGIGLRDRQQCYPLLVIQRARLQALLALLDAHGIDVRAIHVDAELIAKDKAFGVRWFGRWLLGGALPARMALSAQALATLKQSLPGDIHWLDEATDRPGIDEWLLSREGHPSTCCRASSDGGVSIYPGAVRRRPRWACSCLLGRSLKCASAFCKTKPAVCMRMPSSNSGRCIPDRILSLTWRRSSRQCSNVALRTRPPRSLGWSA